MYLLVDIGGTNTRIAFCDKPENLLEKEIFETPKSYVEGIKRIGEVGKKMFRGGIEGVVVGAPGPLNIKRTKLLNAPNLPDWRDKEIVDELSSIFDCSVRLFNDCDLVALGEANFGAARGYRIVAYLTFSTGIGGSRVVEGKVDAYRLGFEPGAQIVDFENSLEEIGGGEALFKKHGKGPEEIEDKTVWAQELQVAAICVHNTIVYWSPDIVVLGGGLMKRIPIENVRQKVREILKIFPEVPDIVESELGQEGGLWGGLSIIQSEFILP